MINCDLVKSPMCQVNHACESTQDMSSSAFMKFLNLQKTQDIGSKS